MSGALPPVLHNLYDLTGNTLHLVSERVRCEGKRSVAIFWLGLCNVSTVSLSVVMFKIQIRYLAFTNHTTYHWYHFLRMGIYGKEVWPFSGWESAIYRQFKCGRSQDSNPLSGGHKPHTLPLISLAFSVTCGYMSHGLDFCLGICPYGVFIFEEIVLQPSPSDSIYRCSPAAIMHAT